MANKVGGASGDGRIWEDCAAISKAELAKEGSSVADSAAGSSTAAQGGKRARRPKSLDAKGVGLQAELEAKLAKAQTAGAGAADAKAVEDLMKKKDATGAANEVFSRFAGLIENLWREPAPPIDRADKARFKEFLGELEKDGKIGEFRKLLKQADGVKLPPGHTLHPKVVDTMVHALVVDYGTKAQARTWLTENADAALESLFASGRKVKPSDIETWLREECDGSESDPMVAAAARDIMTKYAARAEPATRRHMETLVKALEAIR